jgi:LCP family protein required for cell wall assembly
VPQKDKPYRVYRGGRARGPIRPLPPLDPPKSPRQPLEREELERALAYPESEPYAPPYPERREPARPPRRRGRRIAFWIGIVLLLALLSFVGWGSAGYFAFRSGVQDANDRLPDEVEATLSPQEGSLLSSPSNILLLGVDRGPGREGAPRADAIVLVRTDPDEHRIAYLSIPRDLRVEIPGLGFDKVNAAYAYGGAELAVRTVQNLTGIGVNHVAIVDFASFAEAIDALGGVTIDVPRPIVANRFDCPLKSQAECDRWSGWRFGVGPHNMSGRRALIYARIRENQLDRTETDIARGARQQQVVQAVADEVASFSGFLRLPFVGDDVVKPLATDLSATELIELGWVKFRASSDATLRCRLGGDAEQIDGIFYILASEENVSVVSMVTGESAPQPPPPARPFAPGCFVGS